MTDAAKQVRCNGCGEWYDARAASCYLCGHDRPEYNAAIINAVHTERVNSALARQAGVAAAEKRVSSQIPQNAAGKTGPSRLYDIPGARDLAASIKSKLQEGGAFG